MNAAARTGSEGHRPIGLAPAELVLAAACCRWPRSEARDEAVREAAGRGIDWQHFERVVTHHRVAALAADGLSRAGVPVPPALAEAAASAARRALRMARETVLIQQAFDRAGISMTVLKGAPLAQLAYGELGVKQSWDIDLLTSPEDTAGGRRVLEALGYALRDPIGEDRAFARFAAHFKECVFHSEASGIAVELHWRLVDNPALLAGVGPGAPTQDVLIGGGRVRTLADEALFAYLCVHGAYHGWARLKWLADLAAWLARREPSEVAGLYRAAAALGAGRTPAVALLLCHRLLGLTLEPELLRTIGDDRQVQALVRLATRLLGHAGGAVDFALHSYAGWRLIGSRLLFASDAGYLRRELALLWTSRTDRTHIPLPRPLHFLYHFLRLPLFLARAGRRGVARLAARPPALRG